MKFHRFPHLVQRELCSLLHPFDLVLLSFCSDRTRRAVKKAIGKQKNEIWVSGNKSAISIHYRNIYRFDYICYVTKEWRPVSRPVICIEINGVDVGISWTLEGSYLCSINVHNKRHIMLMYKYICNLFNASEEFYVKTDRLECEFSSVKRSYLWDSQFTMDKLDKFYRYNPGQEFSEVECRFGLNFNNKQVFEVRNLILRGSITSAWHCFRMFRGEHAYFEDTNMSSVDIMNFSKEWMKRTKDDELKSVIFRPKEVYDFGKIKAEIRKISCENKKKQTIYPYKSIITQYQKFPSNIFDCTDGIDIRRDTDGKLATVTVFQDYVTFFVWD